MARTAMARAGPSLSQEPGASSRSLTLVTETQHLAHFLLLSQALSKKYDGKWNSQDMNHWRGVSVTNGNITHYSTARMSPGMGKFWNQVAYIFLTFFLGIVLFNPSLLFFHMNFRMNLWISAKYSTRKCTC